MILNKNGRPINPYRSDGYVNPITGYGGADDNIESTIFAPSPLLDQSQLEAQYQSNWIVSRGVEAPVNDRLSKGVLFLTNDDDSEGRKEAIEDLEKTLKQVKMWKHLITAKYWGRLFGGAIIYFDFGDDQSFRPAAATTNQSINFELRDSQRSVPNKIWVVERFLATPVSYYTPAIHGLDHPKLGEPEVYSLTLQTTGWSRLVFAHESRCIIIDGLPLSTRQRATNLMWGNSVLQRVNDAVKYFGISLKAMADTFEDFNYKSLQIENLENLITQGSWELIGKQTAMAAKNTHNQNIGIHGGQTKLIKTATTVTGLPDMASHMSNVVAAAFNIPHSRLFSAEGGALAGTAAETDLKNYHESLRFDQKHKDTQHIERFLFLLGFDPANFPFVFPPLRDLTLKEKLEAEKIKVDMYAQAIISGMIHPEEAAVSLWSTPETNLEQTIIDFEGREPIEPDEETNPEELEDKEDKQTMEKEDEDRADMDEKEEVIAYVDKKVVAYADMDDTDTIIVNPDEIK